MVKQNKIRELIITGIIILIIYILFVSYLLFVSDRFEKLEHNNSSNKYSYSLKIGD